MRTKTVKRYYCDFCSKGFFKQPSALQHEVTCYMNPNRTCWLCEDDQQDHATILAEAKKRAVCNDPQEVFSSLSDDDFHYIHGLCHGCPACTLAVLRQAKILAFTQFDYKKEMASWHAEQSRELRDSLG